MNPTQLWLVLKAHYKASLAVALLTIVSMITVNYFLPKVYTATTSVYVDSKSAEATATMMMPINLGTQLDIISSDRVARKVVRTLGLDESAAVRDQWMAATGGKGSQGNWLAELMIRGLRVTPSRESSVISISYSGAEPAFVASVANAFAQAYIDVTLELKIDPARKYARWFGEQGQTLRDNVEKAQAKLSAFQQEKGLVAGDERMDTESSKLSDLSTQLIRAQSEANDVRVKLNTSSAGEVLPDIAGNAGVAALRAEIGRQESKLQETAVNLGVNHPQYLRMQSEIAALKQRLNDETKLVTGGLTVTTNMGTGRVAILAGAVEAQKKKLLLLKNDRDQLAVLQRDVEAAKNAYDMVNRRYMETTLTSQATEANVSVLSPATVPLEPSFPKKIEKVAIMAVAIGLLLGIATAFGIEKLDRRIRSAEDLTETMQLPVLGTISRDNEPRRLTFWRRNVPLLAR